MPEYSRFANSQTNCDQKRNNHKNGTYGAWHDYCIRTLVVIDHNGMKILSKSGVKFFQKFLSFHTPDIINVVFFPCKPNPKITKYSNPFHAFRCNTQTIS